MLFIVTALSFTLSRNHSSPLELSRGATSSGTSRGQHSPSLEMSYWRTVIGKCRPHTPNCGHTEQIGKYTERQCFAREPDLGGAFCSQGSTWCKRRTDHASNPPSGRLTPLQQVLVSLSQGEGGNGGIVSVDSSEDSLTATSSFVVSPVSDSTPEDPKSTMPNGTFCDSSCSSSSHFSMPFHLAVDFGGPPLMRVLGLQSALRWPMRPQRKLFFGDG